MKDPNVKGPFNFKRWLPFEFIGDRRSELVTFSAQPIVMFKPIGLMFWGLPPGAELLACQMMHRETILAGFGNLPAQIFSRAQSYEQLAALVDKGEEIFHDWMTAFELTPANVIRIILKSDIPSGFLHTQVAMWGYSNT